MPRVVVRAARGAFGVAQRAAVARAAIAGPRLAKPGTGAETPPTIDERMALLELIEKGADAELARDLLAYARERLERPLPAGWEEQREILQTP